MLTYAGISLHAVESALVDLITMSEARSARSSLWCAARALDASVVVRARLQPGRLCYRELVVRLDARLEQQHDAAPTATAAAVGLRTASGALETLARYDAPPAGPLDALDDGAVALAALAVAVWQSQAGVQARLSGDV